MSDDNHQQDLATQIREHHRSGELDKALEISARVMESNPVNLEACDSRWELIAEMFPDEEANKRVRPEIESLLGAHPETPEVLGIAYWGYMHLPGRTKNVPDSLFDKMLQYPRTEVYHAALLGLAERSQDARQKWHYYRRFIDECTVSDVPGSSWYFSTHEDMLRLAQEDRSLTSDDFLDELIDRLLKAHLSFCQDTQQWFGWAYTEAVKWRLKFNIRLDKTLEILERAEVRLEEKEEQKWLVEHNKRSIEGAHKDISRLRGEIHLQQERWRESYDELVANAPDFLESLWARFNESAINYLWMLGRSAEGMGEWEKARRYYADAHFAPTPHVEGQAGLERVYYQMQQGATDTFEAFLKNAEVEYRIREDAEREKIRQQFIMDRLNKKATDFRLETLEGETYTLSAMRGKVILLDVGASWCGPCHMAIPEVKIVCERFREIDDVVIWGINSGEAPHQVREFLDTHQPPWPMLLDPHREVSKAYQIKAIPFFILIDKTGNWQYSFESSNLIDGQPLIWMIEALLAD